MKKSQIKKAQSIAKQYFQVINKAKVLLSEITDIESFTDEIPNEGNLLIHIANLPENRAHNKTTL